VHADWLDYDGTQVIAYEDDTSRKITAVNTGRITQFYASGGFRSTEDIDGGLILLMRLQSGIITMSMGHLIGNTLKLRKIHLSGK
jgi:hypothetical protein